MTSVRSRVARHPLATFFAASVALGSLATVASGRLSSNPALLPLVAIPVSFVPTVTAGLVLRAGTRDERRAWRRRLTRVRVGKRWYAIALTALPAVHLAGVGIATLSGGKIPLHPQLLALLPLFIVTNLGEEIGWRGYALPKLQDRMSPLAAALLLGLIWGAFHWVALARNADAPLAYIAVSTIQLTAMSVIMTFVFNGTRESVPVVVLVHAMYDTVAIGVAPLAETSVPLLAFSLTAVAAWVVALAVAAAAGPNLGRATLPGGGAIGGVPVPARSA